MYQGGSDAFLGPRDPIPLGHEEWGCDMEGEVAVITGDVRCGASLEDAQKSIRLVMLCQRCLAPQPHPERAGQGLRLLPVQAVVRLLARRRHAGRAWRDVGWRSPQWRADGHASMARSFGKANTRVDMTFDFPTLIAHAAPHALAVGGHDHRLRHGVEPRRGWRPGQADRRRRCRIFVHRRAANGRNDHAGRAEDRIPEARRSRRDRNAG